MPSQSPLPEGWSREFFQVVDLERSFRALEGLEHFHVETMRGRIRSLQMRFGEAWEHFERAADLVASAEESIPNLVREFLLEIYRFENAILEEPVDPDFPVPQFALPEIPEPVLAEYPEVRYVLGLRVYCEALLRLHLGQHERSLELFRELADDSSKPRAEELSLYYLGQAACLRNAGAEEAEVLRLLDAAALATQTVEVNAFKLTAASRLIIFYRYAGLNAEAIAWTGFVERVDCPRVTRDLFLARAERMLHRCADVGNLVLV